LYYGPLARFLWMRKEIDPVRTWRWWVKNMGPTLGFGLAPGKPV
jgi:hypothetical protein